MKSQGYWITRMPARNKSRWIGTLVFLSALSSVTSHYASFGNQLLSRCFVPSVRLGPKIDTQGLLATKPIGIDSLRMILPLCIALWLVNVEFLNVAPLKKISTSGSDMINHSHHHLCFRHLVYIIRLISDAAVRFGQVLAEFLRT